MTFFNKQIQFNVLAAFVAMAAFFVMTSISHAQSGQGIAIVDIQSLLQKSKAAVSIQAQLEKQRESFQKEFSKFEEELKSAEKELASQRASLSAEEFNKKRENFEEKLIKTRSIVQKRKNALDEALQESMKKLRIEILKIVAEIAEENDYKLVMSRQNVIVVDKGIDITDTVLGKLDKSLKSVDLDVRVN